MRNYRREYDRYHGTPRQRKRRAARNRARYWAMKNGHARKGDGKDIHHRDNNPLNNSSGNLSSTSVRKNRGYPRGRNNKPKKGLSRLEEIALEVLQLSDAGLSMIELEGYLPYRDINEPKWWESPKHQPRKWSAAIGTLSPEKKRKLEKRHQKSKSAEQTRRDAHLTGVGLFGSYAAAKASKPLLTGRTTLYHGTSKKNAERIQRQGLRSRTRGGSKGIATHVLDPDIEKASRKGAFLTKSKFSARSYAAQQEWIDKGGKPGEAIFGAREARVLKGMAKGEGKVLKYNVPLWRKGVKKNLMKNPEKSIDPLANRELQQNTKVFKNRVPEQYRKGSKNYKKLGVKEWSKYLRKHPGRVVGGAGALAGSAALLGGTSVYGHAALKKRKERRQRLKQLYS